MAPPIHIYISTYTHAHQASIQVLIMIIVDALHVIKMSEHNKNFFQCYMTHHHVFMFKKFFINYNYNYDKYNETIKNYYI